MSKFSQNNSLHSVSTIYPSGKLIPKAINNLVLFQVTGVVGRAELLSSIFFILALMTYSRCTSLKSGTRKVFWMLVYDSLIT